MNEAQKAWARGWVRWVNFQDRAIGMPGRNGGPLASRAGDACHQCIGTLGLEKARSRSPAVVVLRNRNGHLALCAGCAGQGPEESWVGQEIVEGEAPDGSPLDRLQDALGDLERARSMRSGDDRTRDLAAALLQLEQWGALSAEHDDLVDELGGLERARELAGVRK